MKEQRKQTISRKQIIIIVLGVLAMFAFAYGLVPLYNVFCQVTGLNGKTSEQAQALSSPDAVDDSRWVTMEFVATNNENLPWQFHPEVTKLKIHPGANTTMSYYAKNDSNKTMIIQAIPSVSPGTAARYLKKTQCFCFNQQRLEPGDEAQLPVIFHLEPTLPKEINTVTLSYTLFDVTDKVKDISSVKKLGENPTLSPDTVEQGGQ